MCFFLSVGCRPAPDNDSLRPCRSCVLWPGPGGADGRLVDRADDQRVDRRLVRQPAGRDRALRDQDPLARPLPSTSKATSRAPSRRPRPRGTRRSAGRRAAWSPRRSRHCCLQHHRSFSISTPSARARSRASGVSTAPRAEHEPLAGLGRGAHGALGHRALARSGALRLAAPSAVRAVASVNRSRPGRGSPPVAAGCSASRSDLSDERRAGPRQCSQPHRPAIRRVPRARSPACVMRTFSGLPTRRGRARPTGRGVGPRRSATPATADARGGARCRHVAQRLRGGLGRGAHPAVGSPASSRRAAVIRRSSRLASAVTASAACRTSASRPDR